MNDEQEKEIIEDEFKDIDEEEGKVFDPKVTQEGIKRIRLTVFRYFEGERVMNVKFKRYLVLDVTDEDYETQIYRFDGIANIKKIANHIANIVNLVETTKKDYLLDDNKLAESLKYEFNDSKSEPNPKSIASKIKNLVQELVENL
jgi:hypothetical protein